MGICIPDSCAPALIKSMIVEYLNESKAIQVSIPANTCQLQEDNTKVLLLDKLMMLVLIKMNFDFDNNMTNEFSKFFHHFSVVNNYFEHSL